MTSCIQAYIHNPNCQSLNKVTICPEFFGTVPNFEGLSRKNTRSFRTPNCPHFRTLSQICPDLTLRCVAVQVVGQKAVDHFDIFACQRCVLSSSKHTKSIFGRTLLIVGWRWDRKGIPLPPYLSPRCLRHLDLVIFAASKSVRHFHHIFMVTLFLNPALTLTDAIQYMHQLPIKALFPSSLFLPSALCMQS